jgi:membrane protease YdiL (CAAX protease family)
MEAAVVPPQLVDDPGEPVGAVAGSQLLTDCRTSGGGAVNAGPLDRFRAASNDHVAWRDVAAFTLLALLVLRVVGLVLLQALFPRAPTFVLDLVDNYTPLFAAVVMLVLVSREGLPGSLGPLGPGRLYALAVLIPALFTLVAALVAAVIGSGRLVTGTDAPRWSVVPVLLAGTLLRVFGEEYGWRGYLLPKLLPLGELRASLIVGVIWGVWHFPNALQEATMANAIAVLLFYILGNTALSLLFTRFFLVSGGSVAVVWVLHAAFNFLATLTLEHLMVVEESVFAGALLVVVAMAAVLLYLRRPFAKERTRKSSP